MRDFMPVWMVRSAWISEVDISKKNTHNGEPLLLSSF